MAVPVKYPAGQSAGTPFATGETKSVVVTNEALSATSGYEGDAIIYSATVKDESEAPLPVAFEVDLEINGTKVITGQVLDASVYDPEDGSLSLEWVVPAAVGSFTVKLVWARQHF